MKRFAVLLASAFLGSTIAGCTGPALEEGMAKGEPSPDFQERMKKVMELQQTTKYGQKGAAAKIKQITGQTQPGSEQPKAGP
jgi:hypothetical protein